MATFPGQGEVVTSPRSSTPQPLLFPFVLNSAGYDSEITISNTSQDTVGSTPQSGTCALTYYGSGAPSPQTSTSISFGQQLIFTLSQGGGGIAGAPGFEGYIIANCTFPLARGSARVYQAGIVSISEDAQILTLPRAPVATQSLLIPFATNAVGFDTGIAIANTTSDPFGASGTTQAAGSAR